MLNFFAFYQAQNLATVLFMTVPAFLASNNEEEKLHPIEILAIVLWVISFALENVADSQVL
jgi:steroid 5-alpha reductase family enzyme